MIRKLKQLKIEFNIWLDDLMWKNSKDRRELAIKRLAFHREWEKSDRTGPNPYTDPDEFDFFQPVEQVSTTP